MSVCDLTSKAGVLVPTIRSSADGDLYRPTNCLVEGVTFNVAQREVFERRAQRGVQFGRRHPGLETLWRHAEVIRQQCDERRGCVVMSL